jgi:ABC-2 type transport system permease protein
MRVFMATLDNQIKSFYRDPQALTFTIVMPLLIMLVLNLFNIHVVGPGGRQRNYMDLLLPGMIALTATSVGMQSVVFGIVRYKERGVLRRIKASPASATAFINGIAASRVVMVALSAVLTYLAGRYIFQAHPSGNGLGLIAMSVFSAPAFIAVGMIVVGLAKNEDQAGPMMFLFFLPMLLFSGLFVPRTGLNDAVAWVTHGLPMTYLVDGLQRVGFRGQGFSSALWTDLLGLTVWAAIATAIATRTWTWES